MIYRGPDLFRCRMIRLLPQPLPLSPVSNFSLFQKKAIEIDLLYLVATGLIKIYQTKKKWGLLHGF
jgi:hypothetical protein